MDKRREYNLTDSSKVFLWSLLLPQLFVFVVVFIFSFFYKTVEEISNSMAYLIIGSMIAQICFAIIYFSYNKKNKIEYISASKISKNISIKNSILSVIISIIVVFGLYNFISLFDIVFTKLGFEFSNLSLPINNFGWLLVNILLLAVLPAIFEELIFRGIIFNGLRKKGLWFATLVSALSFSLMHLSVWQFVYPFVVGVILALLLEKTGSIVYGMIVHFCNNLIVLIISYISEIRGYVPSAFIVDSISKAIMAVFVATVSLFAIWTIINNHVKGKETLITKEKEQLTKVESKYLYISIIIAVAMWLLMALA